MADQPMCEYALAERERRLEPTNEPYAIRQDRGIKLCRELQAGRWFLILSHVHAYVDLYVAGRQIFILRKATFAGPDLPLHEGARMDANESYRGAPARPREFLARDGHAEALFVMELDRATLPEAMDRNRC